MEQQAAGTLRIWANPFTNLRVPKIFNLRTDPYERADITSNTYYDWLIDHVFLLVPAQAYVGQFLMTFKDYPAAAEGGQLQPGCRSSEDAGRRRIEVARRRAAAGRGARSAAALHVSATRPRKAQE